MVIPWNPRMTDHAARTQFPGKLEYRQVLGMANYKSEENIFNYTQPPTSAEICSDWFFYEKLILNKIMTEMFANLLPHEFSVDFVWECEAKIRAESSTNLHQPDARWMRNFCRHYLDQLSPSLYTIKPWARELGWGARLQEI